MGDEGVTPLSTIGEALRSAREAQGKSLDEAAFATRIRSSYLEALEQERFGELGGSVYAKGFLRSYAGYLGIDPAPLLEAYRAQEQPDPPLFEHAPRAIGGLKTGRRGPNWLVVAIVCVSVILLVSLWGLLRPAPDPSDAEPAFVTTPATTGAAAARPPPATTAPPAPKQVTLTLRYAVASWTRVTADGRLAFEGIPGPNQRRTFKARRSLDVVLGYPAGVRLTVNGKDLGVPHRPGNISPQSFTPGRRWLGWPGPWPSEAADDRGDAPQHPRLLDRDGGVDRVGGHQPGLTLPQLEHLEGRQVFVAVLTGEERSHQVAVVRRLLRIDDGHVAVVDAQLHQAVSPYPEGILPGPGELAVNLQDVLVRREAPCLASRDRTRQGQPAWRPLAEGPGLLAVVRARVLGGPGPPEPGPAAAEPGQVGDGPAGRRCQPVDGQDRRIGRDPGAPPPLRGEGAHPEILQLSPPLAHRRLGAAEDVGQLVVGRGEPSGTREPAHGLEEAAEVRSEPGGVVRHVGAHAFSRTHVRFCVNGAAARQRSGRSASLGAMTDQPRLALTFEDVLLVPRGSSIRSRRHVSTRSRFTRGVELAIPIVSANM